MQCVVGGQELGIVQSCRLNASCIKRGEDFFFRLHRALFHEVGNVRETFEGGGHGLSHDVGPCTLHNPHYDFNDALIPLGATFWVKLVQAQLA